MLPSTSEVDSPSSLPTDFNRPTIVPPVNTFTSPEGLLLSSAQPSRNAPPTQPRPTYNDATRQRSDYGLNAAPTSEDYSVRLSQTLSHQRRDNLLSISSILSFSGAINNFTSYQDGVIPFTGSTGFREALEDIICNPTGPLPGNLTYMCRRKPAVIAGMDASLQEQLDEETTTTTLR